MIKCVAYSAVQSSEITLAVITANVMTIVKSNALMLRINAECT